MTSSGATSMGTPSGPSGALSTGFWYMLGIKIVWLMVGLLCSREHRSPWRQALCAHERQNRRVVAAAGNSGSSSHQHSAPSPPAVVQAAAQHHTHRMHLPTQPSPPCSPDLEVKGAVDTILLCAEDGGKVLSHAGSAHGP
jgi:hypothetical protein